MVVPVRVALPSNATSGSSFTSAELPSNVAVRVTRVLQAPWTIFGNTLVAARVHGSGLFVAKLCGDPSVHWGS